MALGLSKSSIHVLALSLALAPFSAGGAGFSGPGFTSPISNGSGQNGAHGAAASTNSTAANLSKVMSVLSMAAGGLYMAKGAQELACCSTGCVNGSGVGSQVTKQGLDNAAQKGASEITKPVQRSLDFWKLRFPDEAGNCRKLRLPGTAVYDFFAPPPAQALGGCIDAMIALVTGGLMLMNGIMGLKAANQASKNAANSAGNMNGMNSYPGMGGAGTSPTPDSDNVAGMSGLDVSGRASEMIKIDPSLLRSGNANDIMSQFEAKFGIPRDKFADSVLGGEDPRKLLGAAPRNALSNEDMNKATNGAKAMTDSEKDNALSRTSLGLAEKELAGKLGSGDSAYAMNVGGSRNPSALKRSLSKETELESLDQPNSEAQENLSLSPDVKAALAAKELKDRQNGITDLTIFQVVHAKYRERSKMIFGYDPDGIPKGVSDANGL